MTTLRKSARRAQPSPDRDRWPAWTDRDRWTITPLDETGPTALPAGPSALDLAYDTGYVVGSEGGRFDVPSRWYHDGRGLRYAEGRQAGAKALAARLAAEADDAREYEAWLDSLAADRMAEAFTPELPNEADGFAPGFTS